MPDASGEKEEERGDHPCYRHGVDRQLWERSRQYQSDGERKPLRDASGKIIVRADHYREIRLHEPWRVPLLFGKFPHPPKKDSDIETKGKYALFAMLLRVRPQTQSRVAPLLPSMRRGIMLSEMSNTSMKNGTRLSKSRS